MVKKIIGKTRIRQAMKYILYDERVNYKDAQSLARYRREVGYTVKVKKQANGKYGIYQKEITTIYY